MVRQRGGASKSTTAQVESQEREGEQQPVHSCSYLALAELVSARLVTVDTRLMTRVCASSSWSGPPEQPFVAIALR